MEFDIDVDFDWRVWAFGVVVFSEPVPLRSTINIFLPMIAIEIGYAKEYKK